MLSDILLIIISKCVVFLRFFMPFQRCASEPLHDKWCERDASHFTRCQYSYRKKLLELAGKHKSHHFHSKSTPKFCRACTEEVSRAHPECVADTAALLKSCRVIVFYYHFHKIKQNPARLRSEINFHAKTMRQCFYVQNCAQRRIKACKFENAYNSI